MDQSGQKRLWKWSAAVIVGIIIIVIGGYLLLKDKEAPAPRDKRAVEKPLPRMANLPPKKPTIAPPPEPSYTPDAPVLEQAREALRKNVTPQEALVLADALPESPERADAAFLLIEFAADEGNAEAMLAVARYYDPTDTSPSGTIRKNPTTAYEWYQAALKGGQEKAKTHLSQLRRWTEKQAKEGSPEARDLLTQWR